MPGWIVAISDFCSQVPPSVPQNPVKDDGWQPAFARPDRSRSVAVTGGYLERLPLAAVAGGVVDHAEIWTFAGRDGESDRDARRPLGTPDPLNPVLTRRVFRADGPAPYGSAEAVDFIRAVGPPDILCVWGLGVDAALLDACAASLKIYNSIDAPALRIPDGLAARFDLFLTGADWQSREIEARIPGARTLVLPIGPAFASGQTFFPTGADKDRDVVYVACAQPYKRHDILFDAMARRPGTRGLLVVGYGHQTDEFRDRAAREGLDLDIVGPPAISHDEVNRQINRARVGVVCGEDDGAPAILTEYQLAGLPVLANARLSCGLQFITPETGIAAHEGADFAEALDRLLRDHARYDPRDVALSRWGWRPSMARLADTLTQIRTARMVP
ncbi:glycosyltransferase [Paracoccus sediminis]|uniref:Glycosyl transferases group 1 n=1 Tax=Paracoccus sediminis TaxID=1214787 RepID=A0A238WQE7_9RHOB|nr:glycosyltransferase [Paracoccus sediminis]TBN50454.1 glycosyltransferase [Paracoccus sediminis]SNR47889.1 Glycosyl transferases group 1 [Paracoccus sediminis]